MLPNTFSRLKKQKNSKRGPAGNNSEIAVPEGTISQMLSASGRIGLPTLRAIAKCNDKETFIRFMKKPVLAGAAIQAGRISNQEGQGRDEMNRTQIFEPNGIDPGALPASEALRHAMYPLIKSEYSTTFNRAFTIGRIEGNDMIMPDFAISKKHAVINIDNGTYYLKDLNSTNGTMINGSRLEKKPVKINDKDVFSFARYEFIFLFPASLYKMLRGHQP